MLACNYMGGFALVCRSLVKREWPEIYANIVKIIDVSPLPVLCLSYHSCYQHTHDAYHNPVIITPHAQHERGKMIGVGVLIYIYMLVDPPKKLNCTLVIHSHFQTFTVGLLVEFID